MAKLFLLLAFLAVFQFSKTTSEISGYYWRDFYGTVTEDALVGGIQRDGRPIYVTKVLYENKLIPGQLYEGKEEAEFEFTGARTTKQNIMILCSEAPEHLEWISTSNSDIHLLTGRIIIIGGYQEDLGTTTYIGRATIDGETSIGKVLAGDHNFQGLWTVHGGQGHHFNTFEVLTYNYNLY